MWAVSRGLGSHGAGAIVPIFTFRGARARAAVLCFSLFPLLPASSLAAPRLSFVYTPDSRIPRPRAAQFRVRFPAPAAICLCSRALALL